MQESWKNIDIEGIFVGINAETDAVATTASDTANTNVNIITLENLGSHAFPTEPIIQTFLARANKGYRFE